MESRRTSEAPVQVEASHYEAASYDELHRWISYWYQIQCVIRCQAKTVLEIGPGTGILTWYLRERLGMHVVTADIDASRRPDVVCSVTELSRHFAPGQFDLVCAFQILEHLPYAEFQPALREMSKISRKRVAISLPNHGTTARLHLQLWRFDLNFGRKLRLRRRPWRFDGQHYWEVGAVGQEPEVVRRAIEEVAQIERETVYPDYPYHRAYELKTRA